MSKFLEGFTPAWFVLSGCAVVLSAFDTIGGMGGLMATFFYGAAAGVGASTIQKRWPNWPAKESEETKK